MFECAVFGSSQKKTQSNMAFPSKQYGLLLPQKKGTSKAPNLLQRPSVFGDDSDDETSVGESLQKEAVKKRMMKQTRLEMHKALEQDSTVYDYDAVYDDIKQQRLESNKKVLGGADKKQEQLPQQVIGSEQGQFVESGELDQQQAGVSGSSGKEGVQDGRISVADQKQFWSCFVPPRAPKYINQLMKAVEDRKKEQERRDDRKIQKEREAEGEEFADKDAYVTSAYRQKLQERKEELEKEKREAAMEAALDVKKQKDLSGFYRHLLNQTVGEEEIPDRSVVKNPSSKVADITERTSPLPSPTLPASGDHGPSSHSDSEEGHDQKSAFSKPGTAATHSKRHYRQRSPASGSGEDEERDREKRSHRDRERDRGRDKNREERDRHRDRDRERDDRHGARRDDKDRRKERDREDDRSRGRKEAEREDRQGRRERSPKERERGKEGEREKRRDSEEDKGKGKGRDKVKESRKDLEKTVPTDTKIEVAGEGVKKGEEDSVEKGKKVEEDSVEKGKKVEEDSVEKGKKAEDNSVEMGKKAEEDSVEKGKKAEEDSVEKGKKGEDNSVEMEKKAEDDSVEKERVEEEERVDKFAKRSSDQTVSSARERYLARQMSRAGSKAYVEKEED